MKYITKHKIDDMLLNLMADGFSFETRMELEQYFGKSYTNDQMERIWRRYQYINAGGEKSEERDKKQNQGVAGVDGRAGD